MQGPDTSFQYISVRRRVYITVGIFTVMTTVIGLFGLMAIMDTSNRLHRTVQEGQEWIRAVDTGRQAQVHFKRQVQEWKDVLLRGNDPRLFESHMRAFEEEERQVNEHLQSLQNMTASLGLPVPGITEAIAVHRQLGHRYRDALAHYDRSRLQSAVLVDAMVRGIDRDPTDKIDAIVGIIKVQANNRLNAAEKMAMTQLEAYRSFSFFLIFLVLASIGFGIYNARSIVRDLPPECPEQDPDRENPSR
jgi:hypothetical protein